MFTTEELHSLARKDPLTYGLMYLDLLDGKSWDMELRQWSIEPYAQVNPWKIEKYPVGLPRKMAIIKSTQAGVSTLALVKTFHFVTNWSARVGYGLPRQQDVLDMVTTRVDPMIEKSPYLRDKMRSPDSVHAKGIADSFIYFMEMSVEPRMLPIDFLLLDEVDLSEPKHMSTALNRMDASRWKMAIYLSTPTLANYGIDSIYKATDMRRWMVKCSKCNHEQQIDWDENLRIVGPVNKPNEVFYGCVKCDTEITIQHMQTGRWVAEHPDLSKEFVGYHVHQMLTTTAPIMYAHYRDPQTTLMEFYRKRLGKPYELGSGSLTRDDIIANCFDEEIDFESHPDGESSYYMSADQGNELQVIIAKRKPDSQRNHIVLIERIPMDRGFDRLKTLIKIFKPKGIIDANPNRHSALDVTKEFPGRILVADYIDRQKITAQKKKAGTPYFNHVTINRTSAFDALKESILKGQWVLPGKPPDLPPDVELVIDHLTAIKRDMEERKQGASTVNVAVWRNLRADHFAHSWSYLNTAITLLAPKRGMIHIIGQKPPDEDDEEEGYVPDEDVRKAIIWKFSQISIEQFIEYFSNYGNTEWVMPFPLNVFLPQVQQDYDIEDIEWCMNWLIKDGMVKKVKEESARQEQERRQKEWDSHFA